MAYTQKGLLDRSLTDEEEEEFKKYAQENDPPATVPAEILHPVCTHEWFLRGWTVSMFTGRLVR